MKAVKPTHLKLSRFLESFESDPASISIRVEAAEEPVIEEPEEPVEPEEPIEEPEEPIVEPEEPVEPEVPVNGTQRNRRPGRDKQ